VWIDPDDFIQESCRWLCHKRKHWKPELSKWSTFAYMCLDQHLGHMSLELKNNRIPVEVLNTVDVIPDHSQLLQEALQVYTRLYECAGEELRSVFAVWIGVPEGFEAPKRIRRRMRFESNGWRLLYDEIWCIVSELELSFKPIHVEVLMQHGYGRLQVVRS
jgi:hypothetical protein